MHIYNQLKYDFTATPTFNAETFNTLWGPLVNRDKIKYKDIPEDNLSPTSGHICVWKEAGFISQSQCHINLHNETLLIWLCSVKNIFGLVSKFITIAIAFFYTVLS